MGAGHNDDGGGEEDDDNGGGGSDQGGGAEVGGLMPPLRGKGMDCTGVSRRGTRAPTSAPLSAITS